LPFGTQRRDVSGTGHHDMTVVMIVTLMHEELVPASVGPDGMQAEIGSHGFGTLEGCLKHCTSFCL
jgi:hypothetical protein